LKVTEIWETQGVMPVVRRLDIEYLGFARHEDELQLRAEVGQHGGATTTLHYELSRSADGTVLMRAVQTLAYLNTNWKPTRVPAVFRKALAVQESSTH
jgi:acyl-CoA thioesterase FadM